MRADHLLRLVLYIGLTLSLALGVPGAGAQAWWAVGVAVTVLALARFPDAWRGLWAGVPAAAGLLLVAGGLTYAPERAAAFGLLAYLLVVALAATVSRLVSVVAAAGLFAVHTWGAAGWDPAAVPWEMAVARSAWFVLLAVLISGLTGSLRRYEGLYRRFAYEASTDVLTGLPNRREIINRLDRALTERAGDPHLPMSVLMVDLDRFKFYNDAFGHQAGDEVLHRIATVLAEGMEPGWSVGRLGGDEFLVILPGLDLEQAEAVGQTLVDRLSRERFRAVRGKPMTIGASIGAAAYPQQGRSRTTLLAAADTAVYAAKARRGNRVQST